MAARPSATSGRVLGIDHLDAGGLRRIQRTAGNAAATSLLGGAGPTVQRLQVDMTAGGSVGDAPAANPREAVRLALDRMHVLWGINDDDYRTVYPVVSALPPGAPVTDPAVRATVSAALTRTQAPVLVPEVARAQFGAPLGAGVGTGQPNQPADVTIVQDLLDRAGLLAGSASATERAVVAGGGTLDAGVLPQTFAGIGALKMRMVAGHGAPRWEPLIRADEADATGGDRLADRTFQFQDFMVFVPSAAVATTTNDVHVFFSAGGVVGGTSHVEHHGLRGASEAGDRILIAVQGQEGQAFTISDQQIRLALEAAGRPASIASLTISAHSRGNQGLARTLRRRLLVTSLIQHITVLDGNDQARQLLAAFAAARIPLSRVTAEIVTTGQFGTFGPGVRTHSIDPGGARAIGYARLIQDAAALGRVTPMPPAIVALATAAGLPPRGAFTAVTPAPPGKTDIRAFIRSHAAQLAALRVGERRVPDVGALAGSETTSPYAFVEWNDLLNLRDATAARSTWRSVSPGIYSHHLFVAEMAGEVMT
ncbi:hypothetical protein Cch01nite_16670 [Cellulomonas chitinilytica]|uniref:Uncharacterized protein n=1 Tax=Cellulomonas chitinilytica TaxID=398759 RepID=A0A919P0A1_9CELL|nr:hypothetical protein [Cellulomonas chitinilytica]GIG20943.1 hypothetical protein Cch01nite_16670 [Cellulomonas chitinilytica]